MNFFSWWRSLWRRDAVNKAIATAKVLIDGLTTDQFYAILEEVVRASRLNLTGVQKAKMVRDAITSDNFASSYKLPPWINHGVDMASTVVQLAWVVAKIIKRIQ